MNKDKSSLLDSFYSVSNQSKDKSSQTTKTKVVTYYLKVENVSYVDLRSTHFGSKSAFINHLIEADMKEHPDIVRMAKDLCDMKDWLLN